jgi:hypothetical protein
MSFLGRFMSCLIPVLAVGSVAADTTGCASPAASLANCTPTPIISPTSASLDHRVSGRGNLQYFSTGELYPSGCAVPTVIVNYTWNVSDTVDATVANDGGISCVNATAAPITVYSSVVTFNVNTGLSQNVPTNLPTATLTCN